MFILRPMEEKCKVNSAVGLGRRRRGGEGGPGSALSYPDRKEQDLGLGGIDRKEG
jgi:hypothetical protein